MVSSFLFLVLELVLVWGVGHATGKGRAAVTQLQTKAQVVAEEMTVHTPASSLPMLLVPPGGQR